MTPIPAVSQRQEGFLLFILAAVQFSHILDFMIIMPLGPQLMRLFSISPSQFGLLVSSYTFSASIAGLFSAFFIDRFDRKRALLFLYGGFAVATLCCALTNSYVMLTLARIMAGAFGGTMGALVFSIIGDVIPNERRGKASGTVMSAFSLASIAGVPLGLFLANHADWHAPFYMLGAISFCVLIAGCFILRPMNAHRKSGHTESIWLSVRTVISHPNHLRAFAFSSMLMLAGFSVIPYLSPYMVSNAGLSEHDLTYMYLIGGTFTFFTSQWIGRLADRYGKYPTFTGIALISIVPILLVTHMPQWPFALAISCSTMFMVFVSGRFVPAMAMITASVESRYRGSFMSINASFQQMAAGVAALVAGMLIDKGMNGTIAGFSTVGYVAAGATLLAIWLAKRLQIRG